MFLLFSPFSYLFSTLYLTILLSLSSVSDFFQFWLLMEFLMLLFMGVAYTVFTNKVSSLMVYFFVQSLSSFLILLSYFIHSSVFMTFSFFLKLGMFPFVFWYISSLSFFPSSLFFFASTFQKLPPLFMLLNTGVVMSFPIFWVSAILSVFVGGSIMLTSQSLRFLLVASSVGNNGWLLLGVHSSTLAFISFTSIYFISLFGILSTLKQFSEIIVMPSNDRSLSTLAFLSSFSGLPPSPLFMGKVFIILGVLSHSLVAWPMLLFLLASVLSSSSYVCYSMIHFMKVYRV